MISKKEKVNLYECLLNNYIDDDMQSFLRPLELSQNLMFQSKFTIRDNFITPNGHLYNTFAFVFNLLCLILSIILEKDFYVELDFLKDLIPYFNAFYALIFFICTFCLFFSNIFDCMSNIELVINMQSAIRDVKYSNDDFKNLVVFNWIFTCGVVAFYFAIDYSLTFESVYFFITDMILTFMDLKMVYAIRIMKLLKKILNSWIENMQNSNMFLNVELEASNEKLDDWKRLMKVYHNLSDAFLSYKKVFSMTVSIYFFVFKNKYLIVIKDKSSKNITTKKVFYCYRFWYM